MSPITERNLPEHACMHVLFSQVFIFICNGTIQRAEEKLLDLYSSIRHYI